MLILLIAGIALTASSLAYQVKDAKELLRSRFHDWNERHL